MTAPTATTQSTQPGRLTAKLCAMLLGAAAAAAPDAPSAQTLAGPATLQALPTTAVKSASARDTLRTQTLTPDAPTRAPYLLGPGDVVKISVYKQPDLSGPYRVRDDGTISVPLIGAVTAHGRSLRALEQRMETRIAALTSWEVFVSAEVSAYRPVYIIGAVEKPGAVPWRPDLIALQLVSVAGGYQKPKEQNFSSIGQIMSELHELNLTLTRARVRLAGLLALRDDQAIVAPPAELEQTAPPDRLRKMVEAEQRVLTRKRVQDAARVTAAQRDIDLIRKKLASLETDLALTDEQLVERRAHARKMKSLKDRSLLRADRLFRTADDVRTLERRRFEVARERAAFMQELNNAEKALTQLTDGRRLELEQNIVVAQTEADRLQARLKGKQQFLIMLGHSVCLQSANAEKPTPTLKLLRDTPQGRIEIDATERTPILPGDTLNAVPAVTNCG